MAKVGLVILSKITDEIVLARRVLFTLISVVSFCNKRFDEFNHNTL